MYVHFQCASFYTIRSGTHSRFLCTICCDCVCYALALHPLIHAVTAILNILLHNIQVQVSMTTEISCAGVSQACSARETRDSNPSTTESQALEPTLLVSILNGGSHRSRNITCDVMGPSTGKGPIRSRAYKQRNWQNSRNIRENWIIQKQY